MSVTPPPHEQDLDVVVIGAGFSGLYMLYRLRQAGFSVRGIERGSGVGGVWFWNRYPGARCDCESTYYSYSFLPELEQEWPLEERFPGQPRLLAYLEEVASRLDLRKDFTFEATVQRMEFDQSDRRWEVRVDNGEMLRPRFVVSGVGCLSAANIPDLPGLSEFAGKVVHTAAWPPAGIDLRGQRVGVIGTGASGIQSIPKLAEEAAHLTVFQRTPQFAIPAVNAPLDPQFVRMWKSNYREWRRRSRGSSGGIPYPRSTRSALDVTPEDRARTYESAWELGGPDFPLSFSDLMLNDEANGTAADFVRAKIDEIVTDPELAERLKPWGFPFGAKRLPMDTGYYATYNRENVSLVDLRENPLERITATGVLTADGDHPLDVLVLATGFDAMTGPLLALDIHDGRGHTLREQWGEGYLSYLGLAVPGFPNLFTITGPGSPSVLVNMPVAIEQHVEWITDCLESLRDRGITRIEATEAAAVEWTSHAQAVADRTLFTRAASWYTGENVAGKPRRFMPYLGGMSNYEAKCTAVAVADYAGFETAGTPALSATEER